MKLFVPALGIALCALAMSACSINPITEDRMPKLDSGQGLAGLAFDSDGRISQVVIVPVSGNGRNLYIPAIPSGQSLFLFVAPVGQNCVRQFHVGKHIYTAQRDDQCFAVKEGRLSYGGNYAPYTGINLMGVAGGMSQGEDMQELRSS